MIIFLSSLWTHAESRLYLSITKPRSREFFRELMLSKMDRPYRKDKNLFPTLRFNFRSLVQDKWVMELSKEKLSEL